MKKMGVLIGVIAILMSLTQIATARHLSQKSTMQSEEKESEMLNVMPDEDPPLEDKESRANYQNEVDKEWLEPASGQE